MSGPASSIAPFPSGDGSASGLVLSGVGHLTDQIYTALREAIVRIQFKPGQMLSEKETAEALGASKTPVREAFIRLSAAGLVEIVPQSGTYVTRISITRYIEARFVRLQLEVGAAKRAAGFSGDAMALVQLDACVARQREAMAAQDWEAFFRHDEAFHRHIFEMAGLGGVWHFMRQSQADVDRIRHLKRYYGIRRTDRVVRDHEVIVEALRAGDRDAAEARMAAHIGSIEGDMAELSTHPDLLGFIDQLNGPAAAEPRLRRAG